MIKPIPLKPSATPQFQENPAAMFPDSAHNRAQYIKAVAWLRRGRVSKWVLDHQAEKKAYGG